MSDALLTPQDVVRQMLALGDELTAAVEQLKDAEYKAVMLRHKADMVESRAFLNAEGSMDLRKHQAQLVAEHPRSYDRHQDFEKPEHVQELLA